MGPVRKQVAKQAAREASAQQIAEDAGVLKRCEKHPGDIIRTKESIEEAKRLASSHYKDGYYHDLFVSERDFLSTINLVVERAQNEECPSCKLLAARRLQRSPLAKA